MQANPLLDIKQVLKNFTGSSKIEKKNMLYSLFVSLTRAAALTYTYIYYTTSLHNLTGSYCDSTRQIM